MLQNIITYSIVLGAFLILSYRFYRMLTANDHSKKSCGGCTGCDLKNEILKNKKIKTNGCSDPLKENKQTPIHSSPPTSDK